MDWSHNAHAVRQYNRVWILRFVKLQSTEIWCGLVLQWYAVYMIYTGFDISFRAWCWLSFDNALYIRVYLTRWHRFVKTSAVHTCAHGSVPREWSEFGDWLLSFVGADARKGCVVAVVVDRATFKCNDFLFLCFLSFKSRSFTMYWRTDLELIISLKCSVHQTFFRNDQASKRSFHITISLDGFKYILTLNVILRWLVSNL